MWIKLWYIISSVIISAWVTQNIFICIGACLMMKWTNPIIQCYFTVSPNYILCFHCCDWENSSRRNVRNCGIKPKNIKCSYHNLTLSTINTLSCFKDKTQVLQMVTCLHCMHYMLCPVQTTGFELGSCYLWQFLEIVVKKPHNVSKSSQLPWMTVSMCEVLKDALMSSLTAWPSVAEYLACQISGPVAGVQVP